MNAPAKEYDGIHKYIRITDIDEQTAAYKQDDVVSPDAELEEKYKVKKNDILFARTGASTGKSYLYDINDGVLYYAGFLIRGNVKIDNNAKFVFLQTKTGIYKNWVRIMSTRSGQPGINSQEYSSYRFRIPSKAEQNKIAQVFSLIDDRIQTQIGAIEDYKRLKGYLIDKLIKQQDCTMKIGDVIAQKSERNRKGNDYTVLSVSNQKGFVAQSEQFEEREVASEDKSSYKIVRRDDFAYNPARINVGSIARLINYDCGIVSPMYICFHADKCVLPEFLGYFFESRCFATEVDKRLEGSVRLCLSYDGLCDIPIQIPDVEKQRAIIQKLDAVSQKIVLEEQCLDLFKQQKDYLLKNMFV